MLLEAKASVGAFLGIDKLLQSNVELRALAHLESGSIKDGLGIMILSLVSDFIQINLLYKSVSRN